MGYEARHRKRLRVGWYAVWNLIPTWKKAFLKVVWWISRDRNHEKIMRIMRQNSGTQRLTGGMPR